MKHFFSTLVAVVATTTLSLAQAPPPQSRMAVPASPDPNTPPPLAIGNPPTDPNLVTIGGFGVPTMCAGERFVLGAGGGNGTYTWSPNVGLSSTTGASVVVGPLVTTTYTVTSTNPSTGAPTTASMQVVVLENCCPKDRNVGRIINVPGNLFNASTGSPFTNPGTGAPYPTGTHFHFTGASPIIFSGLAFQPPMGSVLLMDGGKDLYLQGGASLNLPGVSITAACDQMWGKLWVRNSAAGLRHTYADGATAAPALSAQPTLPGLTTLHNQISHSLGGIEFEQPSPTVTNASGATNVPYCYITDTEFLHNERSISLYRSQYGENIQYGTTFTYVTNSTFDSRPESFKSPKAFVVGTADYPHYSQYQAFFTGFGGFWQSNSHKHALFGFHCPDDGQIASLSVVGSQFADCYLAGVNINATNKGGGTVDRVVYIQSSTFTFPALLSLPTTPQFTSAISADVADQVAETRGVYCKFPISQISYSTFTQANDPYTDFAFTQRTRQIGVKGGHIGAFVWNNCSLLHVGLLFTNVTTPNYLANNTFTACSKGIEAHGTGIALKTDSLATIAPPVPWPLSCNTFDRANATRPGTAYGIYLDADARFTFDPMPVVSPAPTLQNKFLDYNTGRSGFYAIYNASSVPPASVRYTTYPNYIGSTTMLSGHSNLNSLISGITLYPGNGNYVYGQACGTGNPGLERTVPSTSALAPSSPNPASDHTSLHYQLALDANLAEIEVRRATDGHLAHHDVLRSGSTAYQLVVRGWPSGLYVVTLRVNGLPAKSTKLVVQ